MRNQQQKQNKNADVAFVVYVFTNIAPPSHEVHQISAHSPEIVTDIQS